MKYVPPLIESTLPNRYQRIKPKIKFASAKIINLLSRAFWYAALPISLILVLLTLNAESLADQLSEPAQVQTPRVHWQLRDNPEFAMQGFDDSDWPVYEGLREQPDSIFWIRAQFTIDGNFVRSNNNTLNLSGTGAFDIFLDGRLLGSSGIVGATPEGEKPGALQSKFGVPLEFIGVGNHVLAIRASAHHLNDPTEFNVSYRFEPTSNSYSRSYLNLILLGVTLAAIGILSTFFAASGLTARRRRVFVTTIIIATSVALITGVETAKEIGSITYTWRESTEWLLASSAILIFVCMPLMLLTRLAFLNWRYWLSGLLIVVLVSGPDWPSLAYEHDVRVFISLCIFGLAICASAPMAERRVAIYYAVALGICLIGIIVDPNYKFLFLVTLTLLLAIGFVIDIRSQELSARQAQLAAVRLEAEMLKRNLQPHFLMNSLTAITEWIETSPKDAVIFIQNLADELRFLISFSGKKLIPLKDEMELCRAHIRTMGMRYKKTLDLETVGLTGNETIPPGVFHTLLENALSHNRYDNEVTIFMLQKTIIGCEINYRMSTPLGKATQHSKRSTGSGLKYIKSKLQESYPNRWSMNSQPRHGHWVTELRIKDQ